MEVEQITRSLGLWHPYISGLDHKQVICLPLGYFQCLVPSAIRRGAWDVVEYHCDSPGDESTGSDAVLRLKRLFDAHVSGIRAIGLSASHATGVLTPAVEFTARINDHTWEAVATRILQVTTDIRRIGVHTSTTLASHSTSQHQFS